MLSAQKFTGVNWCSKDTGNNEVMVNLRWFSQLSGPIAHCLIPGYLLRGFENQSFNVNILFF